MAMDTDSDSESESPGLSLLERARLRASPEKAASRKRKRPDDGQDDSDWEMSNEPPLRRRKVLDSSPESSTESSMPLKARSSKLNSKRNGNGPAVSRKRKVIESPSDSDSEHDENWPVSTKRALRKKTKAVSYKE